MTPDDTISDAMIALNRALLTARHERRVGLKIVALEDARFLCDLILFNAETFRSETAQTMVDAISRQRRAIDDQLATLQNVDETSDV